MFHRPHQKNKLRAQLQGTIDLARDHNLQPIGWHSLHGPFSRRPRMENRHGYPRPKASRRAPQPTFLIAGAARTNKKNATKSFQTTSRDLNFDTVRLYMLPQEKSVFVPKSSSRCCGMSHLGSSRWGPTWNSFFWKGSWYIIHYQSGDCVRVNWMSIKCYMTCRFIRTNFKSRIGARGPLNPALPVEPVCPEKSGAPAIFQTVWMQQKNWSLPTRSIKHMFSCKEF